MLNLLLVQMGRMQVLTGLQLDINYTHGELHKNNVNLKNCKNNNLVIHYVFNGEEVLQ